MRNKWIVGVVLALVVIAGVAAAYKLTRPSTGAKGLSGKRIEATFLAYGIEPETAAEIKIGAPIYDETGKECFTITNITTSPAEVDAFDSKGELHVVGHPILKDVVITAQSIDAKVAWVMMIAMTLMKCRSDWVGRATAGLHEPVMRPLGHGLLDRRQRPG